MNFTTFDIKTFANSRIRKKENILIAQKRYKTDATLNASLTLSPLPNSSVPEESFDPTIVLISDEDEDKPSNDTGTNVSSPLSTQEVTSFELSVLRALRVWVSVAQDCQNRQECIPYFESSKLSSYIRSLQYSSGSHNIVVKLLDEQMLTNGLALVESFSSFFSNVDGSYCTKKSSQQKTTLVTLEEYEKKLRQNIDLLGCLDVVLLIAALPSSTLLNHYLKRNNFIMFVTNFLRLECLEFFEYYLRRIHKKSLSKKKNQTQFHGLQNHFQFSTECNNQILNSTIRLNSSLSILVSTHSFPQLVLHGIVSVFVKSLQHPCIHSFKNNNFYSCSDELLQAFNSCVIDAILFIYAHSRSLTSFIETSLIDSIPQCIWGQPYSTFRKNDLYPIVILLLKLPVYSYQKDMSDAKKRVSFLFCNETEVTRTFQQRYQDIKACVDRFVLLIMNKTFLFSTNSLTETKSLDITNSVYRSRHQLFVIIKSIFFAFQTFFYPTATLYIQQFSHVLYHFVAYNLDSTESKNKQYSSVPSHFVKLNPQILSAITIALKILGYMTQRLLHFCKSRLKSSAEHHSPIKIDTDSFFFIKRSTNIPTYCSVCSSLCESRNSSNAEQVEQFEKFQKLCDACNYKITAAKFLSQTTLSKIKHTGQHSQMRSFFEKLTGISKDFCWDTCLQDDSMKSSLLNIISLPLYPCYCLSFLYHFDSYVSLQSATFTSQLSKLPPNKVEQSHPYFSHIRSFHLSDHARLRETIIVLVSTWLQANFQYDSITEPILSEKTLFKDMSISKNDDVNITQVEEKTTRNDNTFPDSTKKFLTIFMAEYLLGLDASTHMAKNLSSFYNTAYLTPSLAQNPLESHLALLFEKCIIPIANTTKTTLIQNLLYLQTIAPKSFHESTLQVVGNCCLENIWMFFDSEYGLQIVNILLKAFQNTSSECLYMLSFFRKLWRRVTTSFPNTLVFQKVILQFQKMQRVPHIIDQAVEIPSFFGENDFETFLLALTEQEPTSTNNLKTLECSSTCISSPVLRKNVIHCEDLFVLIRLLEILFRLFLPIVICCLEHDSVLIRSEACSVLDDVVERLPRSITFLPYLIFKVVVKLNQPEESHAFRYTAAKIFNKFFFLKPVLMIRQGGNNSTCLYFTTEDTDAFIKVFYSYREFIIKKNTGVSHFRSTGSLEKLWFFLKEKLNNQVFVSDSGEKEKENNLITTKKNSFQTKNKTVLIGRFIDNRLPIFVQILLFGLATQSYSLEDLYNLLKIFFFKILELFVQQSTIQNTTKAEATTVMYLKGIRLLLQTGFSDINSIKYLISHFRRKLNTKQDTIIIRELCHIVTDIILNHSGINSFSQWNTPRNSSEVSSETIKHFCTLQDLLLDHLVTSGSRFSLTIALQCLSLSVGCITKNYSHIIEPLISDSLVLLIPFSFMNKHPELYTGEHFYNFLRYGITCLTRRHTGMNSVNVIVDPNNDDLLKKQFFFVFEGYKRRVWILGVLSSIVDFQNDVTQNVHTFRHFLKIISRGDLHNIVSPNRTRCDDQNEEDITSQLLRISSTLFRTKRTLSNAPHTNLAYDTCLNHPLKENLLVAFQNVLNKNPDNASKSLLVLSRIVSSTTNSIIANFVQTQVFFSDIIWASFFESLTLSLIQFCDNPSVFVFNILLNLCQTCPFSSMTLHLTFEKSIVLHCLLLQGLEMFLTRHHQYLCDSKFVTLMTFKLHDFNNPKVQLTAISNIINLMDKLSEECLSFQPLMVYWAHLHFISRGYYIKPKDEKEIRTFHIQCVKFFVVCLKEENYLEFKNSQLASLKAIFKLHLQGLVNPSLVMEIFFSLIFHMDIYLRSRALHYLKEATKLNFMESFLFTRMPNILNHSFLNMIVSAFHCRQDKLQNVCTICGLFNITGNNFFPFNEFFNFYRERLQDFSVYKSYCERIMDTLVASLHVGVEPFVCFVSSTLSNAMTYTKCDCASSLLLRNLCLKFSLSNSTCLHLLIYIFFLQWIATILVLFPYDTFSQITHVLDNLTINLYNDVNTFINFSTHSTLKICDTKQDNTSNFFCEGCSTEKMKHSKHFLFINTNKSFKENSNPFVSYSFEYTYLEERLIDYFSQCLHNSLLFCPTCQFVNTFLLSLHLVIIMGVVDTLFCLKTNLIQQFNNNTESQNAASSVGTLKSRNSALHHVESSPPTWSSPFVQTAVKQLWEALFTITSFSTYFTRIQTITNTLAKNLDIEKWLAQVSVNESPSKRVKPKKHLMLKKQKHVKLYFKKKF